MLESQQPGPSQISRLCGLILSHLSAPKKPLHSERKRPGLAALGEVGEARAGVAGGDEKWSPTAERHARRVHFHR